MSELINVANSVGQTIAFTKMLFWFCIASSFCLSGGFIITKTKKETAKNAYYVGGTSISLALCIALISYQYFARVRQVKGKGAFQALNAATGGFVKVNYNFG